MALPKEKRELLASNASTILAAYAAGIPPARIAASYGVGRGAIRGLLARLQVDTRSYSESQAIRFRDSAMHCEKQRDWFLHLYFDRGLSFPRMSEVVGLHPDYINKCFREWGIVLRTEKQRGHLRRLWEHENTRELLFYRVRFLQETALQSQADRLGVSRQFLRSLCNVLYLRQPCGAIKLHFPLFDPI